MRNFLLTGASGYIGGRVIESLHANKEIRLHCPLRPSTYNRLFEELSLKYPSVEFFSCELTDADLFEYMNDKSFEGVVHIAGLYDLAGAKEDLYLSNVVATMALVGVCNRLDVARFLHISTVAVAGRDEIVLEEAPLKRVQEFYNEYERTKYLAEDFVQQCLDKKCDLTVFRPGIVLGGSDSSQDIKLDGPYFIIKYIERFKLVLEKFLFLFLPYNPSSVMPFCNVDMVNNAIVSWIKEKKDYEKVYHIIFKNNPTIDQFLKRLLSSFGIKLKLIPTKNISLLKKVLPYIHIPENLYDYLFYGPAIDGTLFERDFSDYAVDFDEYYDTFIVNYKKRGSEVGDND